MRIGIDLDGVLADFNRAFVPRLIRETGINRFPSRPFEQLITSWDYPTEHGYTPGEIARTWAAVEVDPWFWHTLPAYPSAIDDLAELRRRRAYGWSIYFITDRRGHTAKLQSERWLRRYDYPEATVLVSGHKAQLCRALGLEAIIDDRPRTLADCVQCPGCAVFRLARPWNGPIFDTTTVASVSAMLHALERPAPTLTSPQLPNTGHASVR